MHAKHLGLVALFTALLLAVACGSPRGPTLPTNPTLESAKGTMVDLTQVRAIKARHEGALMKTSGVVGTGLSEDPAGEPVIEIYVERLSPELSRTLPSELEGIAVRVVETGRFEAR